MLAWRAQRELVQAVREIMDKIQEIIGKPQLGILWSRDRLGFKRLCGNSSSNCVVYILNCRPVYPISSLDGTILLIETKLCSNYLPKSVFLVVLYHFLRNLHCIYMNLLYSICMNWKNFWQPTVHVPQNIFEKTLIEVGSSHLYASFGTFWVQIDQ